MSRRCPTEPHIHLNDGVVVLVPEEIRNAYLAGMQRGFRAGVWGGTVLGSALAALVFLLGLWLGG